MEAIAYWKSVVRDTSDFLVQLIDTLEGAGARYCVVGGQGVNAYVDPVVSLDLDIVIAAEDFARLESLFADRFHVERFPHSLNISLMGSDLRAQIQTDPRYATFVERAERREVLGIELPVASREDILKGKIWAVQDPGRRPSKRQKDLADIARLLESEPSLRQGVPDDVLQRLF